MSFADDDSIESLRERLHKTEAELNHRNEHIARLEKANKELSGRVQEANEAGRAPAEMSEIEETLKRMMTRIAMILQGTKCVFLIHNNEDKELVADVPALGFEDADVKSIRFKDGSGISSDVFSDNRPAILYDAYADERALPEKWSDYGVQNGVAVPLIVERRDEETNKVMERKTIGVLWVFNKRFGNIFIDEDIQLLERLAKNTAAIINSAESFRQVVKERDEVIDTIQSLTMGLIMVNKNERITQMNQSALRAFGLTKDDLAGGKTLDAVIKDEKVQEILHRALKEDSDIAEEVTLPDPQNPEQAHVFQLQSAAVRNDAGEIMGTAAILNDITEIKNVDKMKTAFVSTVSHELRTPLTSIKGFISTLVQDTEGFYDDEMRHEFYTIIDTECDRLRRLIDDLLNVSRIEAGNALSMNNSEFDIHTVAAKVMRTQEASTYKKSSHSMSLDISSDVPHLIEADEDKVEQIFNNLISNALKYSPNGGHITLAGKMMSPEMIQFSVSDQGMGIPKEHLTKMFQRFHRVDNRDTREIGGTGIGLFLVKALVEMHGGRIWLDSEYGKGTTFFFTMPLVQPDEDTQGELAKRVSE